MAYAARLPGPVSDLWEWQLQGSCRQADPRLFFHTEGERGRARKARVQAAAAICAQCPVLSACRAHALRTKEPYGTWGGLGEDERNRIFARA